VAPFLPLDIATSSSGDAGDFPFDPLENRRAERAGRRCRATNLQFGEGPADEIHADDADGGRRFYGARGTERALAALSRVGSWESVQSLFRVVD
jgi:hypothetical protein